MAPTALMPTAKSEILNWTRWLSLAAGIVVLGATMANFSASLVGVDPPALPISVEAFRQYLHIPASVLHQFLEWCLSFGHWPKSEPTSYQKDLTVVLLISVGLFLRSIVVIVKQIGGLGLRLVLASILISIVEFSVGVMLTGADFWSAMSADRVIISWIIGMPTAMLLPALNEILRRLLVGKLSSDSGPLLRISGVYLLTVLSAFSAAILFAAWNGLLLEV